DVPFFFSLFSLSVFSILLGPAWAPGRPLAQDLCAHLPRLFQKMFRSKSLTFEIVTSEVWFAVALVRRGKRGHDLLVSTPSPFRLRPRFDSLISSLALRR